MYSEITITYDGDEYMNIKLTDGKNIKLWMPYIPVDDDFTDTLKWFLRTESKRVNRNVWYSGTLQVKNYSLSLALVYGGL